MKDFYEVATDLVNALIVDFVDDIQVKVKVNSLEDFIITVESRDQLLYRFVYQQDSPRKFLNYILNTMTENEDWD